MRNKITFIFKLHSIFKLSVQFIAWFIIFTLSVGRIWKQVVWETLDEFGVKFYKKKKSPNPHLWGVFVSYTVILVSLQYDSWHRPKVFRLWWIWERFHQTAEDEPRCLDTNCISTDILQVVIKILHLHDNLIFQFIFA